MSRYVTPNFQEHEVVGSNRRPDLVTPYDQLTAHQSAAASRLLWTGMQPLRDRLGRIAMTSLFRSPELNGAPEVGGVDGSTHLTAEGGDWVPLDMSCEDAWAIILAGDVPGLVFDRINYYASRDVPSFHIDNRPLEEGPPRMRLYVDWTFLRGMDET